uniref:Dioxygenase n=1 Tax=Streptomyces violaceoruber TaxID=1935 RepID=C0Z469_STRVN|nr:dioxygenase [Streptomyces violaceoruber]
MTTADPVRTGAPERTPAALPDPPVPTGDFRADSAALTGFAERGEEVLAGLGPKPDRSPEQQARADAVHRSCRWLRARFMAAHATGLYDELTVGRTVPLRIGELAEAAADRVPGLVPDKAQLAAEAAGPQAHKEGREIDQAIFFRAVLSRPGPGAHLLESMRRPTARALSLLPEFRRQGSVDLGAVRVARREGVAYVTLANTHCLNAEDNGLTVDLETAVDLALLDDDVRVGALRGAEMTHPRYAGRRVFSAGINLKHLHQGLISYVDFLLGRELGYISKLVRGLVPEDGPAAWPNLSVQKPWAAGVDAFAIGGGMQLLLVLDRVVAGADAWFSLPAAQEGIVPGAGNLRLTRITGARTARRVLLGGQRLRASSAEGLLICDEVVEPQDVGAALERGAAELAADAVVGNRRMLHVAEEPEEAFRGYMAEFAFTQGLRLYSEDVLAKVGRSWSGTDGVRG